MKILGIYLGAKGQVRDFVLGSFATYGALWAVLEPLTTFLPLAPREGPWWYAAFVFLSVIGGACLARRTDRIEFRIPGSDSRLEIRFGDILKMEGIVVIPANEFFDGELGDHVSVESLHGRFIKDVLGGVTQSFYSLIAKDLANVEPTQTNVQRPSGGQCVRYPIGTVARADVNEKRYLLAALSRTNVCTLKASATVQDLWVRLDGVWEGIRDYSNGRPASLPLIGSGLSGVGLPTANLIEVIVISFLKETKELKVADKVTLILPDRLAGELDLKKIERSWNYRNGNYAAFYVDDPFNESGANATKDFVSYNQLRMWKGADSSFPFIDSHEKNYDVRDGSNWEKTLKPRIQERLRDSKNMVLFLSSITRNSRALREELDYGINSMGLPVIVVYPDFSEKSDIIVCETRTIRKQIEELWDKLPTFRDSMVEVPTIHVPNKKRLIRNALEQDDFTVQKKRDPAVVFFSC